MSTLPLTAWISSTACDSLGFCATWQRCNGLVVRGFLIHEVGPGPVPPDGNPHAAPEFAAFDTHALAYQEYCGRIAHYQHAQGEAERVFRRYATACRELQSQHLPPEHAGWLLSMAEILGDSALVGVAVGIASRRRDLLIQANQLIAEVNRATEAMAANPQKYLKRKWIFWKQIDFAKIQADADAIHGLLDKADELIKAHDAAGTTRWGTRLAKGGKVLGPLGIGVGVWNDWQEGESTGQIVASQGASVALGAGAGWAASVATGAAMGAVCGSVVPVVGTAVGAVVGTVVGVGVGIFADGAVDSLFENGPDVGKAWEGGLDALAGTAGAIADFFG